MRDQHQSHVTSLEVREVVVLRGTTVLPSHRGTIFLRYQYRHLYGTF